MATNSSEIARRSKVRWNGSHTIRGMHKTTAEDRGVFRKIKTSGLRRTHASVGSVQEGNAMRRKHKCPGIYWNEKTKSWYIQKEYLGATIRKSCRTADPDEAEKYLAYLMEQAREAKIYGVRPSRSFRQACEKFVKESLHLRSIRDIAARLEYVCGFIGKMELQKVNRGSLQVVIDAKHGVSSRTINAYLEDVRRVLNRAAADWIDENGLTWLHAAPKIKLLPKNDAKQPTPISHEEQTRLLAELPAHLQPMVLFAIHTGAREAEICNLKWEWFNSEHGLFLIPSSFTKMNRDRIIVCNSVALSVIGKRGNGLVFGTNKKINNTAWQSARKRAGVECRVHDLRHTFASRLRANNIPPHTIAELLGHRSGNITLHYSAAQLDELKTAVETLVNARPGIILRRVK